MSPMRSLLSASPSSQGRALVSEADVVILDLEGAAAGITQDIVLPTATRLYVKVGLADCERLLEAFAASADARLDGVLLTKVESRETLQTANTLIVQLENTIDRTQGSVDLMPLMETPTGIENAQAICEGFDRVKRLAFGAGDYCRALRLRRTAEETELNDAREALVTASRSLSIAPPIDTPFPYAEDLAQFRRIAERSREMGYQGKICIHPDQVPVSNAVFAVEDARAGCPGLDE